MPALVTCKGSSLELQWNVGSDDFVISAFMSVAVSLLCSILMMAALAALWISPPCIDGQDLPPILYNSFFILLAIEIGVIIVETIIMSISYRGRIWATEKRKSLPNYIYIRLILLVFEIIAAIICSVASFNSHLIGKLECNSYRVAVALVKVSSVLIWIKIVGFKVRMCVFLDPCGCFTPGLLQHLSFLDTADDVGETPTPFLRERSDSWFTYIFRLKRPPLAPAYSRAPSYSATRYRKTSAVRFWDRQVSLSQNLRGGVTPEEFFREISRVHRNRIESRQMERRLRVIFCCLGVGGHRSRGIAVKDIARALYTLFDFDEEEEGRESVRLVLSDVIAGFKLVNRYQVMKAAGLKDNERLEDKFRMVTFQYMPSNQRAHYKYKPPRLLDNSKPEFHLVVDDMIHYLGHAMGMYGWPLYVFSNLACGFCQLASKTCCVCQCVRPRNPDHMHGENCCMCGVAAMELQSDVAHEDIYFISMDNEIYKAPFAVIVDRNVKAVIVSVRGTLSIKDVLTDMSYSVQYVHIEGVNETYVHKGMYAAADEIRKKLLGRTREEIRKDAIKKQSYVDEKEVDTMVQNERRILNEVFSQQKDYQLILSGHSLGAGVASVLALLLRKDYPDLHCYAFSPPGCVFSYPLARYSRKFTTSVVLGNDFVPRLSFRALLYLKQSVKYLLEKCEKPKCEVLFLPSWCSRKQSPGCNSIASLPEGFEKQILSEKTTDDCLQKAVFPTTNVPLTNSSTAEPFSSRQCIPEVIMCDQVKNGFGRFMPTFPPGKIFHLKVNKSAKPCFLGCCYPNELEMQRLCNEDLCMIIIDRGVVEDHLPNHVMDSLVQFKKQCLLQHYDATAVEKLREKRRHEQQKRREARELTNLKGRWVFPKDSDIPLERKYSDVSSTVSSISSTPLTYLTQPSVTDPLPAVPEDTPEDNSTYELDSREVQCHVEVHSEEPLTGSRKAPSLKEWTRVDIREPKQYLSEPLSRDYCDKPDIVKVVADVAVTEPDKRQIAGTVSSMKPHFQLELTQPKDKSEDGPTSIAVQVPYAPTSDKSVNVPEKLNLALNVRQASIVSETKSSVGRRLLTQLSRGGAPPCDRVLTVQARRGFKLKLIIPPTPGPDDVETNI